jgi:hypothetical protein
MLNRDIDLTLRQEIEGLALKIGQIAELLEMANEKLGVMGGLDYLAESLEKHSDDLASVAMKIS